MRPRAVLRPLARAAVTSLRAYVRYTPPHPGKRWIWKHVFQKHVAWRGHRTLARTRFGATIEVTTRDLIQRHIYHYGVWEPNLTQWLHQQLRPSDTFIDVGANVGYFTLLASQLVGPAGRVVALEPAPETFAALAANVTRNRASNVRLLQVAASDCAGELVLEHGPASNSGMTATQLAREHDVRPRVAAQTLASCLDADELSRARVIKIDVEGAEWEALMGLWPALPQLRRDCAIVVELSPGRLQERGHDARALFDRLIAAGFRAHELVNDYDPEVYFADRPIGPQPVTALPNRDADIIFTRT
jgi:FkbM family methyltransferase